MVPFCGRAAIASRLDRATTRRQFIFNQKFLVLKIKAEMNLKPPSGFELVSQSSYYENIN